LKCGLCAVLPSYSSQQWQYLSTIRLCATVNAELSLRQPKLFASQNLKALVPIETVLLLKHSKNNLITTSNMTWIGLIRVIESYWIYLWLHLRHWSWNSGCSASYLCRSEFWGYEQTRHFCDLHFLTEYPWLRQLMYKRLSLTKLKRWITGRAVKIDDCPNYDSPTSNIYILTQSGGLFLCKKRTTLNTLYSNLEKAFPYL